MLLLDYQLHPYVPCSWFDFSQYENCYVVPPVLEHRTNYDAFEERDDEDCFNPIGFEADNKTIRCENFTTSNPNVGLIMSFVTNLNQFAMLYFDVDIEKKNL